MPGWGRRIDARRVAPVTFAAPSCRGTARRPGPIRSGSAPPQAETRPGSPYSFLPRGSAAFRRSRPRGRHGDCPHEQTPHRRSGGQALPHPSRLPPPPGRGGRVLAGPGRDGSPGAHRGPGWTPAPPGRPASEHPGAGAGGRDVGTPGRLRADEARVPGPGPGGPGPGGGRELLGPEGLPHRGDRRRDPGLRLRRGALLQRRPLADPGAAPGGPGLLPGAPGPAGGLHQRDRRRVPVRGGRGSRAPVRAPGPHEGGEGRPAGVHRRAPGEGRGPGGP